MTENQYVVMLVESCVMQYTALLLLLFLYVNMVPNLVDTVIKTASMRLVVYVCMIDVMWAVRQDRQFIKVKNGMDS